MKQTPINYTGEAPQKIATWLTRFAEKECKGVSNLYYQLALAIAQDQELIKLSAHAAYRQPLPNLILAAVHYLLLQSPQEELALYYPSISKKPSDRIPFALFKSFCLKHQNAILPILQTKIVQTNALNRAAYLMPIFSILSNQQNINLIDIGTSAGLNLYFNQYQYDYGTHGQFGQSSVNIQSEIRDSNLPKFTSLAKVKHRIGIDQNPLNLQVEENALWLKALIWPDLEDRFTRIENAIALVQANPPELISAQQIADFRSIIKAQASQEPLVVFHTHVLYQFTLEERIAFREMLDEIGSQRDFYYLAVEGSSVFDKEYDSDQVLVELTTYTKGNKKTELLAETNGHANWIKWLI